jgi:hypothetical protein
MTAALPQRAADLKIRLSRLADLSSKVQEASDLEGLRQDLARRVEKLDPQIAKQTVLNANGVALNQPVSVQRSARRAAGLLEKFQAAPTVSTLKKGQVWRTLLEDVDAAAGDLNQGVHTAWREARKSFFAGDNPQTLHGRLAHTSENDAALSRYRVLHQALDQAFTTAPVDQAAVDEVRRLAGELELVAKGFNFDVPDAVKAFLEAVQSVGGASLALLTEDVVDWLKKNQIYDAYRISAKART